MEEGISLENTICDFVKYIGSTVYFQIAFFFHWVAVIELMKNFYGKTMSHATSYSQIFERTN